MKHLIIIIICALLACEVPNTPTQPVVYEKHDSEPFKKGKRQLEVMGYKNIEETPYPLFCCAEEDSFLFSTGFKATTPDGEIVTGCFCVKGMIRNAVTIRFE